MVSSVINSLSASSTAQQKYKLAYLQSNKKSLTFQFWSFPCTNLHQTTYVQANQPHSTASYSLSSKCHILCKIYLLYTILRSFHSRKLDILALRWRTTLISSLVIFFFCLSGCATYHFCNRSFPCRLNNNINCICNSKYSYQLYTQLKFWTVLSQKTSPKETSVNRQQPVNYLNSQSKSTTTCGLTILCNPANALDLQKWIKLWIFSIQSKIYGTRNDTKFIRKTFWEKTDWLADSDGFFAFITECIVGVRCTDSVGAFP